MEISPLTCSANQWTGFYMVGTTVMKELINFFAKIVGDVLLLTILQRFFIRLGLQLYLKNNSGTGAFMRIQQNSLK